MGDLAKAIKRLRDEVAMGRHMPERVYADIRELLRDYDRLDGIVRMMYPPHLSELSRSLKELMAAQEQVDRSLSLMRMTRRQPSTVTPE